MLLQSSKHFLSATGIVLLLGLCIGCGHADYKHTLRSQGAPAHQPVMLAAYQPWFGGTGHINVGYSSQDRTVLERQIADAKQLGISGFVVNWYGRQHPFEDSAYALLQQVANADPDGFKVALMYDENDSDPAHATDAVLADLNYAYQRYISRSSQVPSSAYLRYNGQPVIFVFPKDGHTDWNRVRQVVNTWEERPMLIYKDPSEKWAASF